MVHFIPPPPGKTPAFYEEWWGAYHEQTDLHFKHWQSYYAIWHGIALALAIYAGIGGF
jgi:hypothetical protein